jgi:hypothetical protein
MSGMIVDPEVVANELGHALGGPDVAAPAVGFAL